MKRRQFTKTMAFATGGAVLSAAGLSAAIRLLREVGALPASLSRPFFEARLGEEFRMDDRGSSTVVLTDVMDASPHAPEAQFHVIFEASPRTRLEEGIHRLENGGSGPLDLFLSQSELSGNRQRLTATINLQTAA